MCKQLWALSQVQGVQCAVFSTHCTVHTPRTPRTPSAPHTGAHVRSSMSDPQFPLSSLSGFQLPSDQRPPLIRDVCLPWRRVRVTTDPRDPGNYGNGYGYGYGFDYGDGEGAHLSCERNNNDLAEDLVQPVCKSIKCIVSIWSRA